MKLLHPLKSILLVCLFFAQSVFAQPGFDDDVNDVPINGGIEILILFTALFIFYVGGKFGSNTKKHKSIG